MILHQHTHSIWTIEGFLSKKACEDLIIFSEMRGFEEAKVSLKSGAKMMKGVRNNYRLMYADQGLADRYWEQLKPFCPSTIEQATAVGLNEQFRFYRYDPSQRFKRHIDGRFKRNEQEESRITFMVYLNNDFEGGETVFDEVAIQPKIGTALCFIHELKHEGKPVISGTKYVIRTDVMYRG